LSERIAPCGSAAILRPLERAAAPHDLVDEPDLLRLMHVHAPARDDHLHRACVAHDQRQAHRHAVAADDVPAPLGRAELRVLGRDPDVGEHRGLEPGGERVAVHGGDDGLEDVGLARVAAFARAVVEVRAERIPSAHVAELQLAGVLQVPPGAEGGLTGAGDDKHEGIVVVAEALPRVMQLLVHGPADRVVLAGPVVGQGDDMVLLLVEERFVVHWASVRVPEAYGQQPYGSRISTSPWGVPR
jgi:hypothetical protein